MFLFKIPYSLIRGVVLDVGDERLFRLDRIGQDPIIFMTHSRESVVHELEVRWKTERMTVLKRYLPFMKKTESLNLEGISFNTLAPPVALPKRYVFPF